MSFIQLRGYKIITMFEGGLVLQREYSSDSGTGYKNHCFLVKEGIFYFRLTLENRAVLLSSTPCYSPSSSKALQNN